MREMREAMDSSTNSEDASMRTTWHGIIGTGQSLSVGFQGDLSRPTPAAPNGLKLHDEDDKSGRKSDAPSLKAVPFTEPIRPLPKWGARFYPTNIAGLTPHHSMTQVITELVATNKEVAKPYVTAHTAVGSGGAAMEAIRKGGGSNAYAASIFEAKAFQRIATEQGHGLVYDAVILTHGETDAVLNNDQYGDLVIQMQRDYAEDLRAITGQTTDPVLILSQQNTCPPTRQLMYNVTQSMWQVQENSHNSVICSGPKYQYEYAAGGLHLPRGGYERLGEKYGQVYYETVIQGKPFVPLCPTKAVKTQDPDVIAVQMSVPKLPLTWDDHLPKPHQEGPNVAWRRGRGFEVRQADGAHVVIESVSIEDQTVLIKLERNGEARKLPLEVGYAASQLKDGFGIGFCGGTTDGRLGHLRDSDPGISIPVNIPDCKVEKGSPIVASPHGFEGRTLYDIVDPGGYVILETEDEKIQLDRPWEGETKEGLTLTARHNQQNYCVAFVMKVA